MYMVAFDPTILFVLGEINVHFQPNSSIIQSSSKKNSVILTSPTNVNVTTVIALIYIQSKCEQMGFCITNQGSKTVNVIDPNFSFSGQDTLK